jgi:hypothetical protein
MCNTRNESVFNSSFICMSITSQPARRGLLEGRNTGACQAVKRCTAECIADRRPAVKVSFVALMVVTSVSIK